MVLPYSTFSANRVAILIFFMCAGKYHIYPQSDSTAFSITQQCKASLALPMSMLMLINFVSTLILMSRSLLWLKMKVEPYVNRRCFNVKMSLLFHRIVIVISLHFKVSTIFFLVSTRFIVVSMLNFNVESTFTR